MKQFVLLKDGVGDSVGVRTGSIRKVTPDAYGGGNTRSVLWFENGDFWGIDMPFNELLALLNDGAEK